MVIPTCPCVTDIPPPCGVVRQQAPPASIPGSDVWNRLLPTRHSRHRQTRSQPAIPMVKPALRRRSRNDDSARCEMATLNRRPGREWRSESAGRQEARAPKTGHGPTCRRDYSSDQRFHISSFTSIMLTPLSSVLAQKSALRNTCFSRLAGKDGSDSARSCER